MAVESFGDGVIWALIAALQVAAILFVILTGDRIDHLDAGHRDTSNPPGNPGA